MSTGYPDTLHPAESGEGGDPAVCSALSLLAAGALSGFAWLADDAAHAPDLTSRMLLSRMAARELAPLDPVQDYQREIGADEGSVEEQIWSYRMLLADLEARTVPGTGGSGSSPPTSGSGSCWTSSGSWCPE